MAAGIIQAIVGLGQIGISATQVAREGKAMRKLRSTIDDSTIPSSVESSYITAKQDSMSGFDQEASARLYDSIEQGRIGAMDNIRGTGGGASAKLNSTSANHIVQFSCVKLPPPIFIQPDNIEILLFLHTISCEIVQ